MKAKHRTKRIQRYRKMLGIIVLMLTITLIGSCECSIYKNSCKKNILHIKTRIRRNVCND